MPIVAKSSGGNRVLIPEGNHMARCTRMVYMGEVDNMYNGELKKTRKVHLTFELPTETHVFDESNGAQPFSTSKTYTLSLADKANLRKDLEAWRGKVFSKEELEGFDITAVLGAPLMLQIGTKTKDNGDQISVIQSMASIPKGMTVPPMINEKFLFSVEEFDQSKFNNLPEWQQDDIKTSTEFKAMNTKPVAEETIEEALGVDGAPADDLPFVITLLIASGFLLQTLPF